MINKAPIFSGDSYSITNKNNKTSRFRPSSLNTGFLNVCTNVYSLTRANNLILLLRRVYNHLVFLFGL